MNRKELAQLDFEKAQDLGVKYLPRDSKFPAEELKSKYESCTVCMNLSVQEFAFRQQALLEHKSISVPVRMLLCTDCGHIELWSKDEVFLQNMRELRINKGLKL